MRNKNSESTHRSQMRRKRRAVESFGGKCCLCGYNKCINALEFHHVDGKKENPPSYVIGRWSWERAKKELEKCILVCANCHREAHYSPKDIELKNKIKPWINIECKQCHVLFDTKNENQKYCSDNCSRIGSRKVTRPSRADLSKMIKDKIPWTRIGKMFGVSDNAVS